jgi:hypothetical protein
MSPLQGSKRNTGCWSAIIISALWAWETGKTKTKKPGFITSMYIWERKYRDCLKKVE